MSMSANARRRAALKGKKRPPEVIAKISATRRGQTISAEARAKISAALKGRKASPERSFNSRVAERVIKLFKPDAYEAKRKRASAVLRKLWQDPEFVARRAEAQRLRWERYRAQRGRREPHDDVPEAMEVG